MKTLARAYYWILVSSMLSGGCLYYGPHGSPLMSADQLQSGNTAYFDYIHEEDVTRIGKPRDWGLYQVYQLTLPLSLKTSIQQEEYNLFYYRPKGQGPFPAVVILPITRGEYYTQSFAIYLAERGYACLRFGSTKNFTDDAHKTLESAEQILRHYVIDVRRGIDWLTAREEVDPHRLGIMGISLGAIVASLVMEVDSRIKAGVFLLGGADLAGILDTSEENSLIRFRQRVMDHQGLNPQTFRETAARVLRPVEPLSYVHRLDPRKILMINGYFDRVIYREYVKVFWEASGHPELIFIPTGHYSAGLLVPYARAKTIAHVQKILH